MVATPSAAMGLAQAAIIPAATIVSHPLTTASWQSIATVLAQVGFIPAAIIAFPTSKSGCFGPALKWLVTAIQSH